MKKLLICLFLLVSSVVQATVNTTINSITYTGNGATTNYSFSFAYPGAAKSAASDFSVTTVVNGVTTVLPTNSYAITFNSPVSPNPTGIGGSVLYPLVGSPLVSGATITITRTLPAIQGVSLSNQGTLYPPTLEQEYDYLTMLIQQGLNISARAIVAPVTDLAGLNYTLPAVSQRAGLLLCFDALGNVATCSSGPNGLISSAMQPVVSASTIATARSLLGISSSGKAVMSPYPNQLSLPNTSPWNAVDPWGNPISCVGTTTQCLQELIYAAAANGWNAEVDCPSGIPYTGAPTSPVWQNANQIVIEATSTINIPVAQDWHFHANGCLLNINVATVPGIIVDSEGASEFIWDGIIVYNVTSPSILLGVPSCGVLLQPFTHTDDGFAGIYAGKVRINSIAANGIGGTALGALCANVAVGSISANISLGEINCTETCKYSVLFYGASGSTGLLGSIITIDNPHSFLTTGVQVGVSTTNQGNYSGNIWNVNGVAGANGGRGIDTYGSYDIWNVGTIAAESGSLNAGIAAEVGANNNVFISGAMAGVTAPLINSGSGNMPIGAAIGLACSGSPTGSFAVLGGIVTHC